MNRIELQQLAFMRLAEARTLLAAGHPAGAFYLAGYAVECALKACIAKGVQQHDFPDKDKVLQSYSHNLVQLVRTAGLEATLQAAVQQSRPLEQHWSVVKDWSESSRYTLTTTMPLAEAMVKAVGEPVDGVLAWCTHHW
jgi:HEPN domain-containing protein